MSALNVVDEAGDGLVRELRFVLDRDGHRVPGVLWRPDNGAAAPVVLLGHGGSGHKRDERQIRLATLLVARAAIACLAIDGPFHGDRAIDGDGAFDYQRRIARTGAEAVHTCMRSDWLGAVDAAEASGWVDGSVVAYLGMSMGARYGLLVCQALGSRLRCAVLGKFGLTQSDQLPGALAAPDLIRDAAGCTHAPVLQHVQWHDELFPLAGQLDLFELFSSSEKTLLGRPGPHAVTRPDDEIAWCEYVSAHLT